MSVSTYMLSILKRQLMLLGAGFARQYRHAWLVWEPGLWRPAKSIAAGDTRATLKPGTLEVPRPAGEDAVCFALTLEPSQRELQVGRASSNDVVVNDLTASREQFRLAMVNGRWLLRGPNGAVTLNGTFLDADAEVPLSPGDCIAAGDVKLTFYDTEGLAERLSGSRVTG